MGTAAKLMEQKQAEETPVKRVELLALVAKAGVTQLKFDAPNPILNVIQDVHCQPELGDRLISIQACTYCKLGNNSNWVIDKDPPAPSPPGCRLIPRSLGCHS